MTFDEALEFLAVGKHADGYCCDIRENGECCLVPSLRAALVALEKHGWKLTQSPPPSQGEEKP